jgi:hypothetical protein
MPVGVSFWGGVAVGVVTGLILAGLLAVPRWYLRRREERRRLDEQERFRRIPVTVGASIVAGELREAADIAARCEGGHYVPEETRKLRLEEWEGRRGEMLPLRDDDAELWQSLTATYEALSRSKRDGAWPPAAADLRELAEQLDAYALKHGTGATVTRSR